MIKKIFILLVLILISFYGGFSCTIFSYTINGKTYFCNNEDYSNPDTEIRFNPSKRGKYAWVYLGFSNNWAQGGVNEKGLCWDWVAGYKEDSWKEDKSKKAFSGNLSEKMITKCATVEEAVSFFKKYNDNSFSYARIMLADKNGNSAIIRWKDGNMFVTYKKGELHTLGYRGNVVKSYFDNIQGEKDISYMAGALSAAHQNGQYPTQYSNIFSLNEGKIIIYNKCNYNEYIEIDYLTKLKKGYVSYKIPDLFNEVNQLSDISLRKNVLFERYGLYEESFEPDNYKGYYYTGDRFFLIIEKRGDSIISYSNDFNNNISSDTLRKTFFDIYENNNSLFKFSEFNNDKFNKVLACWDNEAFSYQRAKNLISEKLVNSYIGQYMLSDNSNAVISFNNDNLIIEIENKDGKNSEYIAKAIDENFFIFPYGRLVFDEKVDLKYHQINFISNKKSLIGKRIK